jgi:hypothetical protein
MANGWIAQAFECPMSLAARDAADRMGESAESGEENAE